MAGRLGGFGRTVGAVCRLVSKAGCGVGWGVRCRQGVLAALPEFETECAKPEGAEFLREAIYITADEIERVSAVGDHGQHQCIGAGCHHHADPAQFWRCKHQLDACVGLTGCRNCDLLRDMPGQIGALRLAFRQAAGGDFDVRRSRSGSDCGEGVGAR